MLSCKVLTAKYDLQGGDFAANQRLDLSQSTAIRDTFAT